MMMEDRNFHFHDGEKGTALTVQIMPGDETVEITRIREDGTLMIKIPQSGGDENQQLIDYFAQQLSVSKTKINVVAGKDRNEKLISIIDAKPKVVQKQILSLIT